MRIGFFEALRRGLDNTVVNWPILLLRLAETVLFLLLAVGAVIVTIVPIAVSVGIEIAGIDSPEDVADAALALASRWLLLVWILLAAVVVLIVFLGIHSFVEAGAARIYADADRIAGRGDGERSRFRVFSFERWMTGGRQGWWTVFWIYNAVWSVAALILLVPLLPTLVVTIMARENPQVVVAAGCLGLALTVLLMIPVGIVAGMWSKRAIAAWAADHVGAATAIASARHALRIDFGRHLGIALAMIVVGISGSLFFASFSFFAGFLEVFGDNRALFALITLPLRLVGSLLSSAFSAAVSSWYLAAYTAVAMESR